MKGLHNPDSQPVLENSSGIHQEMVEEAVCHRACDRTAEA
jgi:hypothetical protein